MMRRDTPNQPHMPLPSAASLPPDCINLGQGYMNFAPPAWACEGAEAALKTAEGNQAAPVTGIQRLREAIKAFYGTQYGKELDAETEIVVTGGAIIGECTDHAYGRVRIS